MKDLDARTIAASHARSLVAAFVSDLGGEAQVTTAMAQLIQRAAILSVFTEDLEVRWVAGEKIHVDDYLAAVNTQRRVLMSLGLERRMRNVGPTLSDILSGRDIDIEEDAKPQEAAE